MRRFLLVFSLSAAIFFAGAMVPDRGGVAGIGTPTPVDCCDSRA